ncbi:hypothetical protein NDR87_27670 [Nocardia sp. CDC159]|uniref:Uncharacterized protein n=1 Tax=Nocardia pulmonis TaxID=2951408 RepID=A0A9X2EFI1_9NOCA|nr:MULTISPECIES: hypothetical protein [Nocardia]MCM6777271.1 hypothetical protein [Nocardia pulmonis]MCM6790156.1 hypothetical protein [Nocardia sp. CDC159]
MSEKITYPDIEKALTDYLLTQFAALAEPAKVVVRMPESRPPRVVRVARNDRKLRSDREDFEGLRGPERIVDRPRVVFECYDDSGAAAELAGKVRTILAAAAPGYIGQVWCDYIEDVGVENSTDSVTAAPRYLVTTDLYVRGTVLA